MPPATKVKEPCGTTPLTCDGRQDEKFYTAYKLHLYKIQSLAFAVAQQIRIVHLNYLDKKYAEDPERERLAKQLVENDKVKAFVLNRVAEEDPKKGDLTEWSNMGGDGLGMVRKSETG